MNSSRLPDTTVSAALRRYNAFLLLVAGLGGLLYGIDVGIIGGAVPYLQATSGLTASELSFIVAAVLLGSVFSTLFSGLLADWMGRKPLMILSGCAFVVSIPVIALSQGYGPLLSGRLLQGASGGVIGVVVPLYLAECLAASSRGKGTAIFQWMLTLGIVAAALMGMYFSYRVDAVAKLGDAAALFRFKDHAWRSIFWVSLPPGIVFVLGSLFVTESPRWLFRRGQKDRAEAALLKSRSPEQATLELAEMEATAHVARANAGQQVRDSLLRRKYAIPFLLACVILFCNTATGVNSIIGYNTGILLQSGLSDLHAHWGYVIFTVVNFLATMIGIMLVDRKGSKFLLVMGTSGVIFALVCVALLFQIYGKTERGLPRCSAGAGFARPGAGAAFRSGYGEQAAGGAGRRGHAGSTAVVLRWPSFIPTAALLPRQAMCARTIRRQRPSKSRAQAACPQTELRRCSGIHLPILQPRGPRRW